MCHVPVMKDWDGGVNVEAVPKEGDWKEGELEVEEEDLVVGGRKIS